MNKDKSPFEVGDEVVCIRDHGKRAVVKGDKYFILGLRACGCGLALVDIGKRIGPYGELHSQCGTWLGFEGDPFWLGAILFRRIEQKPERIKTVYVSVPETIKEQSKELVLS